MLIYDSDLVRLLLLLHVLLGTEMQVCVGVRVYKCTSVKMCMYKDVRV